MIKALERLRQAREEQGIDIDALAKRTRIRVHLLEAVEQGRFEALPRGVYARAVIRAYASAVGVEPNRVVTEVAPLLPEAEDALDGIARVRGFERTLAADRDTGDVQPVSRAAVASRIAGRVAGTLAASRSLASIRLPGLNLGTSRIAGQGRRIAAGIRRGGSAMSPGASARAGAVDALLLGAMDALLLVFSARAAGVTVPELMAFAAPAMVMLFALIGALYFLLLGGIGGATPGARIAGVTGRVLPASTLRAVSSRAAGLALREMSIVVELAVPPVLAWLSAGRPSRANCEG